MVMLQSLHTIVAPREPDADSPDDFKSLRRGRRWWSGDEATALADAFVALFPASALAAIEEGKVKPGPLITLDESDEEGRLGVLYEDIEENITWLRPLIKQFPDRVPSAYLVADSLMILNKRLNCKLLQLVGGGTAQDAALAEAFKMKRLVQRVRFLWRVCGPDAKGAGVRELKALRKKPAMSADMDYVNQTLQMLGLPVPTATAEAEELVASAIVREVLQMTAASPPRDVGPQSAVRVKKLRKEQKDKVRQEKKDKVRQEMQDAKAMRANAKGKGIKGKVKGKRIVKASFKRVGKRLGNAPPPPPAAMAAAPACPVREEVAPPEPLPEGWINHTDFDLPAEALPQRKRVGKYSYALSDAAGNGVDVILRDKTFWVKKVAGEFPAKRNFAWSCFGGPRGAWAALSAAVSWQAAADP